MPGKAVGFAFAKLQLLLSIIQPGYRMLLLARETHVPIRHCLSVSDYYFVQFPRSSGISRTFDQV